MAFMCLECGKKFKSVASARRAMDEDGCPNCGGSDIDLHLERDEKRIKREQEQSKQVKP